MHSQEEFIPTQNPATTLRPLLHRRLVNTVGEEKKEVGQTEVAACLSDPTQLSNLLWLRPGCCRVEGGCCPCNCCRSPGDISAWVTTPRCLLLAYICMHILLINPNFTAAEFLLIFLFSSRWPEPPWASTLRRIYYYSWTYWWFVLHKFAWMCTHLRV